MTPPTSLLPPSEPPPDADLKQLYRARLGMWTSLTTLVLCLATVALTRVPAGAELMPGIMVLHVVVLALFGLAMRALTRLRKSGTQLVRVTPLLRPLLAPWVLLLGIASVAAVVPVFANGPHDFSTHASADGAHFYVQVRHEPEREISEAEYGGYERQILGFFASIWTIFAYASLLQWRFAALARQQMAQPGGADATPRPIAPQAAWKSPALIGGLWVAGLASTLLPPEAMRRMNEGFCAIPPPGDFMALMAGLPVVFISVSALFLKRSPYESPWLAAWADEQFGAGAFQRFMVRLKPLLLMGACALCSGLTLGASCPGPLGLQTLPFPTLFFGSAGLGFIATHFILRRRGIPGV